jgi:hypothetical protein
MDVDACLSKSVAGKGGEAVQGKLGAKKQTDDLLQLPLRCSRRGGIYGLHTFFLFFWLIFTRFRCHLLANAEKKHVNVLQSRKGVLAI